MRRDPAGSPRCPPPASRSAARPLHRRQAATRPPNAVPRRLRIHAPETRHVSRAERLTQPETTLLRDAMNRPAWPHPPVAILLLAHAARSRSLAAAISSTA